MSYKSSSVIPFSLGLLCVFILVACKRGETTQPGETKTISAKTATTAIKPPPKFGIYYEAPDGLADLEKKPDVATVRPSFLIYLDKLPEAEKVRLRFSKGSASGFVFGSGTVTSSENDNTKDNKPPKRDDYKNILVLKYGEESGVFEPQVMAVEGHKDLHRATYPSDLKAGEYMAFYFIDESEGEQRWEKARFQFAGQFTVK